MLTLLWFACLSHYKYSAFLQENAYLLELRAHVCDRPVLVAFDDFVSMTDSGHLEDHAFEWASNRQAYDPQDPGMIAKGLFTEEAAGLIRDAASQLQASTFPDRRVDPSALALKPELVLKTAKTDAVSSLLAVRCSLQLIPTIHVSSVNMVTEYLRCL